MPLLITRKDLERTIELLALVRDNAESLPDVVDANRLMELFDEQLNPATNLRGPNPIILP
jgi:hypothetical protein